MDKNTSTEPPRRYFSQSLLRLREELAAQKEQQLEATTSSDTSPTPANILRKRCIAGDPAESAVPQKKMRTLSPQPSPLNPSNPSNPSPPSPPEPSSVIPPSDLLPSPKSKTSSLPISQTFTTSEPRPLEKIEKLQSSHLEICAKPWADLSYSEIEEAIEVFREDFFNGNGEGIDWNNDERLNALRAKTSSIHFEAGLAHEMPHCHLYKLEEEGPIQGQRGEEVSMVQQWKLPNQEFQDLWQKYNHLFYEKVRQHCLTAPPAA